MIYLEKIAKEVARKDSKNENIKTVGTGAVGAKMIHGSKDRIIGQKTLYHGTSKKNWESIKREGLKANRGGISGAGAAVGNRHYQYASKGKVHVTGKKSKAIFYSRVNAAGEAVKEAPLIKEYDSLTKKHTNKKGNLTFNVDDTGMKDKKRFEEMLKEKDKLFNKELVNLRNRGGTHFKIKMDYDRYKNNFQIDPDETGDIIQNAIKGDIGKRLGKHHAARGTVDIGTDEIVGLHKASKRVGKTLKNMPNYIKNNKGRFGTGVAMAGAGTAMLGKSVSNLNKKQEN